MADVKKVCIIDELKELGFDTATKKVHASQELLHKMSLAYANFDHITEENIQKFQIKIQQESMKDKSGYRTYNKLIFHDIKNYTEVPPVEALTKLKEAKQVGCFDYFQIAKVENVREMKDPILFGRINGCGDYFFIAQWDDDVTIEAIKKASQK